jgi:hypothetical protein
MKEQDAMGQLRLDLALSHAIDQRVDGVVRAAASVVALLREDRLMRENQVRNLLDVAASTESLLAVSNFVRYQMGRSAQDRAWLHNGFGERIVKEIEDRTSTVQKLSAEVAQEVRAEIPAIDTTKLTALARLRLARLFLGYLNRWFYYASRTKEGWDDVERFVRQEAAHV